MKKKAYSALAIAVLFAAFAMAGTDSHQESERELMRYCERVVDHYVDKSMGLPIEQRRGHKDHRGIAAEACPGMRAAP